MLFSLCPRPVTFHEKVGHPAVGLKYSITFRPLGAPQHMVLPRTLNSGVLYPRQKMKRARTPSAAIPRKKVKRTKSFKMIPSKSLVFQANTVGAGPERKNIDSNLVGGSGVATPIGLPDWSPTITLLNRLLRERRK